MKKVFTLLVASIVGGMSPLLADTWEITYPMGGVASSVDDVQIKNSDVAYRYLADDATATLLNQDNESVKTLVRDDITLSFKGSYCTVDFEFNPAITEAGSYTISVPEGIFTTTDGAANAAFDVNFAVQSSSYTAAEWDFYCLMPEGGKAEMLDYIVLMGQYPVQSVSPDATAQLYNSNFEIVANLDATNNLFAYNDGLMVALDPAITTPGDYMLVVNQGAVICADANVTNSEAYVQLAVEANEPEPQYTITAVPQDNSTVSTDDGGITGIFITVTGYAFYEANDAGIEMTITKDGNLYATVGASALGKAMDRTSVVVELPEDAQMNQAGYYTVTMPQGYFTMKASGSSEIVNSPEIILNYTLTTPGEKLTWTIEPAPGIVNEIDIITIKFNKPVKPAITPFIHLFFTNYSYLQETVTEGLISVSEDGLEATIDFDPVFAAGGIYQVRLFEGSEQLAVVDGEKFPGINITYTVEAPLCAVSIPESGSQVESIEQTKITFPYTNRLAASENFKAWYISGDKQVEAQLQKVASYDFGDLAYVLVKPETEITDGGEWELVIEKGSLIISNYGESMESPEVTVNFTIESTTSITDIINDANNAEIYNLQGVRMNSAMGLTPGLYIMRGKKVLVK